MEFSFINEIKGLNPMDLDFLLINGKKQINFNAHCLVVYCSNAYSNSKKKIAATTQQKMNELRVNNEVN